MKQQARFRADEMRPQGIVIDSVHWEAFEPEGPSYWYRCHREHFGGDVEHLYLSEQEVVALGPTRFETTHNQWKA